jgi:phospholipid/cholesterol/gamma-HCH transport system ATP-binding protein
VRSETAILELARAVAEPQLDLARNVPLSFRLLPGECALVETARVALAPAFADLCSGLTPPQSGNVRFHGRDWQEVPDDYAAALRGRIGRVFTVGAWVPFLDVETAILLPALHHTRRERRELQREALALAREFGLPGLPLGRPDDVTPGDLDRAAMVRAFLGEPLLVIVEDREDQSFARLPAVLDRVAATRDRGGAVVWLTRERTIHGAAAFPASHHLRLSDRGLAAARAAA